MHRDKPRLLTQRVIILSLTMGLLLIWRERRPKFVFAAGGLLLCVGLAFVALFIWHSSEMGRYCLLWIGSASRRAAGRDFSKRTFVERPRA